MAEGVELAKAYITLIPTMRGMKGNIRRELSGIDGIGAGKKIGADMSDGVESGFDVSGISSKLAIGAAAVAAAAVAASAAVIKVGKESIGMYADFEQLSGGIETLFKGSAGTVMHYAENAYKTAGMSANEYMDTVTSFSASLIQSLGGNTAKAAEMADMAITDMADNANKMGTSMESIENAYQGFAKQNYTMLDNLKLGYGGTKEEMERLLADAEAISGIHYDISSYADVVNALHVIQTEMGITGTTAEEAAHTIQGSMGMAKAAYDNFLTGLANPDANIGKLGENLVDSINTAVDNLVPAIETFADNFAKVIPEIAPKLAEAGMKIVSAIAGGLVKALPALLDAFLAGLTEMINYMADHTDEMVEGAMKFFGAIGEALANNIPQLLVAIGRLIFELIRAIIEHIPDMLMAAAEFFGSLLTAAGEVLGNLFKVVGDALWAAIQAVADFAAQMFQAGLDFAWNLLKGIGEGLANIGQVIAQPFIDAWNGVLAFFGIHSPSTLTAIAGMNIAKGFAMGIENGYGIVEDALGGLGGSILGSPELNVDARYRGIGEDMAYVPAAGIGGAQVVVYVEGREGEDDYELGYRIGSAAAYELRMQGVSA